MLLLPVQGGIRFDEVAKSTGVSKGGDAGAVAWFDMDGDGDEDLYVANIGSRNKLFRNDGNGRFVKLKKTGLEGGSVASFGVAVGDYDNDGRLDLFVSRVGSSSSLYRNEGNGRFRDASREAGVGGGVSNSYSAAWADFDRDGRLDLYVANGTQAQGAGNYLYRNRDGVHFDEVGQRAGVRGNDRSLGCAWGDYDGDGLPDLFVANFGDPCRLYRNLGDGTFAERGRQAGVDDSGNGAGAAWGDYDNDGDLDLYVFATNNGPEAADTLYRNSGAGTFADATAEAGLDRERGDGEAVVWADFDADGWLDLFLANRSDFSRQRNRLYLNPGSGGSSRFAELAATAGVEGSGDAHPAAAADYDGDGRVDIFVGTFPGSPDLLFRNAIPGGNTLVVRLSGRTSNAAGIGARVTVTAGDLTMMREVSSSSGRSSQNQIAPHFGLGPAERADRVEIRWPSGVVQTLEDVPAGTVEAVEPAP